MTLLQLIEQCDLFKCDALQRDDFQGENLEVNDAVYEKLKTEVSIFDVRALTRVGGHASDPELLSVDKLSQNTSGYEVNVLISFTDGDALDCSGFCNGNVVQRKERLIVSVKKSGEISWRTTDGVISSGF